MLLCCYSNCLMPSVASFVRVSFIDLLSTLCPTSVHIVTRRSSTSSPMRTPHPPILSMHHHKPPALLFPVLVSVPSCPFQCLVCNLVSVCLSALHLVILARLFISVPCPPSYRLSSCRPPFAYVCILSDHVLSCVVRVLVTWLRWLCAILPWLWPILLSPSLCFYPCGCRCASCHRCVVIDGSADGPF